jgi:hypothetical protein
MKGDMELIVAAVGGVPVPGGTVLLSVSNAAITVELLVVLRLLRHVELTAA